MSTIDYSQKIPNNVNLAEDRTLQRALEQWQPNFLSWWGDMATRSSIAMRSSSPQSMSSGLLVTRPSANAASASSG